MDNPDAVIALSLTVLFVSFLGGVCLGFAYNRLDSLICGYCGCTFGRSRVREGLRRWASRKTVYCSSDCFLRSLNTRLARSEHAS